MKRTLRLAIMAVAFGAGATAYGQRYLTEVFTDADITITPGVTYGTNINFLTSNLSSANVPADVQALQTAVTLGNPIPTPYYDNGDPSTALKVQNVQMDIYQPDQAIDTETARPLVLYLHTGNLLPPPLNGSPTGTRTDSSAVEMCKQFARRGYVAISMSYRLGWNPLAATELERRSQLLNAVYRALQDVRQCIRSIKADPSPYAIDTDKIIVFGEGTGGYISLANATLDDAAELYIEKFRPDPFDPTVSFIDSTQVGNIDGFNGNLTLYRPNGQDYTSHFCVNAGGALADASWIAQGDAPMVSFHTVFDPFAPFTQGIVIVPTTGGPVLDVPGANSFMQVVNDFGNNSAFHDLPDGDPFTDRARALYGTTQTHGSTNVLINTNVEGLFPMVRPQWPAPAQEEASPWQWWDQNSAIAQTVVSAGPPPITANQASLSSNPDMSATKGRTYIDTIMGYANPRIVCALQLGPCSLVGIEEGVQNDASVELYPNPATNNVTITSTDTAIRRYRVFDVNGRLIDGNVMNTKRFTLDRKDMEPGTYFIQLDLEKSTVVRKLILN